VFSYFKPLFGST